jgi:hypothetical protein
MNRDRRRCPLLIHDFAQLPRQRRCWGAILPGVKIAVDDRERLPDFTPGEINSNLTS